MNAVLLSQLVASTVMAGELSLMAAQVSGDLVNAHERLGHILNEDKWGRLTRTQSSVDCLLVDARKQQDVVVLLLQKGLRQEETAAVASTAC